MTTTLAASPRYAKCFRMLRAGLPEGAVRQLMRVQGLDERALALGPDALKRELVSQPSTGPAVDARVFEKSLCMLLVGVPQGAVEAVLRARTLSNARAYEQTLGKLLAATSRDEQDAQDTKTTALATIMARVVVPEGAVRLRMERLEEQRRRERATPWENLFASVMAAEHPRDKTTPWAEHAPLRRFFMMLRTGISVGAVKHALAVARLPSELAHWDPTLPVGVLADGSTAWLELQRK